SRTRRSPDFALQAVAEPHAVWSLYSFFAFTREGIGRPCDHLDNRAIRRVSTEWQQKSPNSDSMNRQMTTDLARTKGDQGDFGVAQAASSKAVFATIAARGKPRARARSWYGHLPAQRRRHSLGVCPTTRRNTREKWACRRRDFRANRQKSGEQTRA